MSDHGDPTTNDVRSTLRGVVGDDIMDVNDDVDLQEALGDSYNSLAAMECITWAEEKFSIEVDFVADDVRFWFSTITRIQQFVREKREDMVALRADT